MKFRWKRNGLFVDRGRQGDFSKSVSRGAQKEGRSGPEKGKRRSAGAGRLIRGRFLEPLKSRNARRHRALGTGGGVREVG